MKKSVLLAVVFMVFGAGLANAQDASIGGGLLHTQLDTFKLDPKMSTVVNYGNLYIDENRQTVRLVYGYAAPCKQAPCPIGMAKPMFVELPITSVHKDANCGFRVIEAARDERPVDGALEIIRIEDHRQDHCKYLVAVPCTEVSYETRYYSRLTAEEIVYQSSFSSWNTLSEIFF